MLAKAVFLEKDGTLVEDVPYNVDPRLIQLSEGAVEGLQLLQQDQYQLFVVTNQSGVARGYFEEQALDRVQQRLQELLLQAGVHLAGFYYCPHHPQGTIAQYAVECSCRKPHPGMLQKAAIKHGINLGRSWMVGDILNDVEAGNRAGCRTVLLDNGNETEWEMTPRRQPGFVVKDLYEAALTITGKRLPERKWSYGKKKHGSSEYH